MTKGQTFHKTHKWFHKWNCGQSLEFLQVRCSTLPSLREFHNQNEGLCTSPLWNSYAHDESKLSTTIYWPPSMCLAVMNCLTSHPFHPGTCQVYLLPSLMSSCLPTHWTACANALKDLWPWKAVGTGSSFTPSSYPSIPNIQDPLPGSWHLSLWPLCLVSIWVPQHLFLVSETRFFISGFPSPQLWRMLISYFRICCFLLPSEQPFVEYRI